MVSECTKVEFSGQHIYVGVDVARKSWSVCIYVGQTYHKQFSQPPVPEVLVEYLRRHFPRGIYHVVYEAGYFGFWIHEALIRLGVEAIVINPADVPTTDKERHTKTDRVDAKKLAQALAAGTLRAIYVPRRLAQEDRTLLRMRSGFIRKQTRTKCQIKAMLRYYGEQVPEDICERYWSRAYVRWLESLTFHEASGRVAFQALLGELLALRTTIARLTQEIRDLARQERYRQAVTLLLTVNGISLTAAMTFLTEIISLDRFKNLDHLLSFIGLVPGEHSTGDDEQQTGLLYRRNPALRAILIECAWVAQRDDPALLQAFAAYAKRMPKSKAIVPVARKLVSRMRFVLKHGQSYVPGVVSVG